MKEPYASGDCDVSTRDTYEDSTYLLCLLPIFCTFSYNNLYIYYHCYTLTSLTAPSSPADSNRPFVSSSSSSPAKGLQPSSFTAVA